jgi:regulatory protein
VSLQGRALQWLAQREHSRLELERKLLARCALEHRQTQRLVAHLGIAPATPSGAAPNTPAAFDADHARQRIAQVLDTLTAAGHLSNERYTASKLRQRAPKVGAARLKLELGRQGVVLDANDTRALQASEMQRAQALWQRRYGPAPTADAKQRARQMRFFVGRGFAASVAARVVRGEQPDELDDT